MWKLRDRTDALQALQRVQDAIGSQASAKTHTDLRHAGNAPNITSKAIERNGNRKQAAVVKNGIRQASQLVVLWSQDNGIYHTNNR